MKKKKDWEWVKCECGCGEKIMSKDPQGRDRRFVNGHNNRKYDDPTQYKREWNHRNRDKRYEYKKQRSYKLKAGMIKTAGGECSNCGLKYDKTNGAVFDFHHINPEEKSFPLNLGTVQNKSLEDLKTEAEKCELLCANCHRIHHSSEF